MPHSASPISLLKDFTSLLFPNLCHSCQKPLSKGEDTICIFCQYSLPQTGLHLIPENPMVKLFWGRVDVQHATSLYYFEGKTRVQHLLHQLKYRGKQAVGEKLGKILGAQLRETEGFADVDLIVPVPLHRRKVRSRGFNQSAVFARGLSEGMEVLWSERVLKRVAHNASQTGKSRYERWSNVKSSFKATQRELIAGKHVLLVDDVVTTGATLEVCVGELLRVDDVRVSVATMAFAYR